MTKEETIKAIAKTIHRVEFPNSGCWFGCEKCSYNGNCDYLKAAELIYEQYVAEANRNETKITFKVIDVRTGNDITNDAMWCLRPNGSLVYSGQHGNFEVDIFAKAVISVEKMIGRR